MVVSSFGFTSSPLRGALNIRKRRAHEPLKLSRGFRIFCADPGEGGPFPVGWKETGGKFKSTEATLEYSSDNPIEYYREREQHALKLAECAASPAIRKIHLEMADCYRTLIAQLSGTEGLRVNDGHGEEPPISMT